MKIQIGGLPVVLFLIFMVLKLTDNIDWSWWWVTAPLWIIFQIVAAIFLIILIFQVIKQAMR